jgi:hypothetical protein
LGEYVQFFIEVFGGWWCFDPNRMANAWWVAIVKEKELGLSKVTHNYNLHNWKEWLMSYH